MVGVWLVCITQMKWVDRFFRLSYNGGAMEKFISAKEAAARLNTNVKSVYRWVSEGRLPAIKEGKRLKVKESALRGFKTHLLNDWQQLQARFLNYLSSRPGKKHAVSINHLCGEFNLGRRNIFALINSLRRQGLPLGASRKGKITGIYYAADPEEKKEVIRIFYASVKEMLEMVRKLTRGHFKTKVPKPVGDLRSWENRKIMLLNSIYRLKGKEKARPLREIAKENHIDPREAFRMLHDLRRRDSFPIASSRKNPKGTYWIQTEEQKEEYLHSIYATIQEMKLIAERLEKGPSSTRRRKAPEEDLTPPLPGLFDLENNRGENKPKN